MAYQVFETTVFNRVLGADARMLFVPKDVAAEIDFDPSRALSEPSILGVRLGVQIPDPEGIVDVFYASLQGRVYTFDADSFDRWRPRWQAEQSEASAFAQEIVFGERTPVSESPLRAESMASLLERGEAYVTNGADWSYGHPLHALGVIVLVNGAILVTSLARATRQTIVIAAKYHLRQALGVPLDWIPPEDRG
ncbi:MAG: hypothetical protein ACJ757_10645 [Gaiellaceae bacterium]